MNLRSAEIDMLHGPLCKKLLLFTLPIALSSMVQQLFNAADTAVVGRFGSEGALAAVGTNTVIGTCAFRIVWICTAFRANPTLPTLYHAFPLSWAATILLVNIGFLLINFTKKPSAAS